MNLLKRLKEYFLSPMFKHWLMLLNFIVFVSILVISFSLDNKQPFNSINIALVGVFVLNTIIFLIISESNIKINLFVFCIIGLMTCMIISFLVNGCKTFPRTPILLLVFSLFIYFWINENRKYLNFYLVGFLLASWIFLLIFTFFEFSSLIHPSLSTRIGSDLGNENDVARHLVFTFLINLYFCHLSRNMLLKIFLIIITIICAFFTFLTGSVSNMILLIAMFLCFVFVVSKKRIGILIVCGSLSLVVIFVVVTFVLPTFAPLKNRILSIFEVFFKSGDHRIDSSSVARLHGALYGFRLFFESPLFGNGADSVSRTYMIMAHNNFAEIGADYGFFALIIEETLILYPLFKDKNTSEKGRVFTLIFCLYIFYVQFFLVVFNSKIESIILPISFVIIKDDKTFCSLYFKEKKSSAILEDKDCENC